MCGEKSFDMGITDWNFPLAMKLIRWPWACYYLSTLLLKVVMRVSKCWGLLFAIRQHTESFWKQTCNNKGEVAAFHLKNKKLGSAMQTVNVKSCPSILLTEQWIFILIFWPDLANFLFMLNICRELPKMANRKSPASSFSGLPWNQCEV